MVKKKISIFVLVGFISVILLLSIVPNSSNVSNDNLNSDNIEQPKTSANLEGSDNILITRISRRVDMSAYGLVNVKDQIQIENQNNNPITSILIGIHLDISDDLVYFEATGKDRNTLLAEREDLIMNNSEMIAIYFDSPLLPDQTRTIKFKQTYKDMLNYEIPEEEKEEDDPNQFISFFTYVYPLLPYQVKGYIKAKYHIPDTSDMEDYSKWGDRDENRITYTQSVLEPFLENLGDNKIISINFSDDGVTKMEYDEVNREIYISPWGLIKVKEEFLIKNKGEIDIDEISFEIPGPAKDVYVYDDLGEILGITIEPEVNYTKHKDKDLLIDLSENRVQITPNSKYRFYIRYFLPFEKYYSINWFQESIKIDVLTSTYELLGRDQTINIIIEGCFHLDSVSDPPDAIEQTQTSTILIYESEYVSPLESREIQFTWTVNFFDILLRPLTFMLLIALISVAYVLIIKTKKPEAETAVISKALIPINELREFISLYEEKNALTIEIREAEELTKRKKMVKRKYKNLLSKNTSKIQEIEKEIIPFKKEVLETNITFENIVKKLEILEAERESVKDSLNLLETRYKRGRLPSKSAYVKLSDNFLRRLKKIDRSIDKNLQQLRSYLL
ncbi:MAG: hypothetical protein ACFFAN_21530 [Promethearchaeota archaeon]